MKLNKLFLMGAMGLGLFACSDDLNVENGQNGGNLQEKNANAVISLDFGKMASRVVTTPDLSGDNKVTSLYVILAPASGTPKIIGGTVTESGAVGSEDTWTDVTYTSTDDNLKKLEFEAPTGSQSVYVVVNPTTVPADFTDKAGVETYFEAIEELPANITGGCVMTNAKGTAEEVTFQSGVSQEITIPVDRIVSKVTVTATALNVADQGTMFNLAYKFRNYVTKSYRMNDGSLILENTNKGRKGHDTSTYTDIAITVGQQPSEVIVNYCMEDLKGANEKLDTEHGDNVTYFTVSAGFVPTHYLDANLVSQSATDAEPATHYYSWTKKAYILESVYNNLAVEKKAELGSVTKYTDGIHYFKAVWVGNETTYNIERNRWYNYDLTSITFPGLDVERPDGGQGGGGLTFSVSIKDYTFANTEVGL